VVAPAPNLCSGAISVGSNTRIGAGFGGCCIDVFNRQHRGGHPGRVVHQSGGVHMLLRIRPPGPTPSCRMRKPGMIHNLRSASDALEGDLSVCTLFCARWPPGRPLQGSLRRHLRRTLKGSRKSSSSSGERG